MKLYCKINKLNVEVAEKMAITGELIYTDNEIWCKKEEITDITTYMSEQNNNNTVNVHISQNKWKMVKDYRKWKLESHHSASEQLKSQKEDYSSLSNFGVK